MITSQLEGLDNEQQWDSNVSDMQWFVLNQYQYISRNNLSDINGFAWGGGVVVMVWVFLVTARLVNRWPDATTIARVCIGTDINLLQGVRQLTQVTTVTSCFSSASGKMWVRTSWSALPSSMLIQLSDRWRPLATSPIADCFLRYDIFGCLLVFVLWDAAWLLGVQHDN